MKGMASAAEGGGDPLLIPQDSTDALGEEDQPYALSLLRSSCDSCWKKKCKCSGEMPCSRCRRGLVQCTYSTKRKLGRPRGLAAAAKLQAQQASDGKRSSRRESETERAVSSAHQFSASPVTGLGGLAESRFLSCFLEHFTPMFPVANEVSIRDGLMHSFAGMWYGGAPALRGQEAFRGRALECAFFSSVAIGGLLSGYPVDMVKNHVDSAQSSVVEFRGLADKHAVSALVLSGMMNILLPPEATAAAAAGAGSSGGGGANAEGRRSLDEAEAIFESLPEKDPLVGVILSFRRMVEGLSLVDPAALCPSPGPSSSCLSSCAPSPCSSSSTAGKGSRKLRAPKASTTSPDPAAPVGGSGGGGGDGKGSGSSKGPAGEARALAAISEGVALTEEGKAILAGADVGRGETKTAPLAQPAHPSFVASDALLLSARFMREEGAGGLSRLRHVHDFVASELNRLVPARAGALVLISLAGTLLAIKTRLQLTDGMLPMAELTTAMLAKCPGWGRSHGRHAAHLSLAVFRLHGHRDAYISLRALVVKTSNDPVPAFGDQEGRRGHACRLGACKALCESLVGLTLADASDDVARSGTGGGSVSGGSNGARKTSRKRPAPPASPSSPRGGGGGGGSSGMTKKPRQSLRNSAARKQQQQQQQQQPPKASPKPAEPDPPTAASSDAGGGAAAWKLPRKRRSARATAPAPAAAAVPAAAAAAVVATSPTAASCYSPATASTGSSSPSSADVAAAAAAVASATANAVAAATTAAAAAAGSPRSSDQYNLSTGAPGIGVERFPTSAGDASETGMWPAKTWGDARGGGGINGIGVGGSGGEGFPVGSTGMNNKNGGDRPHASSQGHQQGSYLPPLSGSLLHPQSGGNVTTGYHAGGGGGGGGSSAGFLPGSSSHYAPGGSIGAAMRHDARGFLPFMTPAPSSVEAQNHRSQQQQQQQRRRVEAAALAGTNDFETAVDAGPGVSPSHRSSVAWWRSDTLPPSSSAAAVTAVAAAIPIPSSSGAGGVMPAVTATSGSWPIQGSAAAPADATSTSSAGQQQPMAWADSDTRNGVPAWFGGGGGVGPITLPPPDRSSSRDWGGGTGGGGGRLHTPSFAVAQRWQQQQQQQQGPLPPPPPPAGGESGSSSSVTGPLGGAGFAAKLLGPTHGHGRASSSMFRAGGGGQHVVDTTAHAGRRPAAGGRGGSEFDFVYELGMLLDEEEFPAAVGQQQQQLGR